MYIGVHNSKPDLGPVGCTIRMREFHQSDLIPKDLQNKMEIFDKVHEGTDAFDVSTEGRT